MIRPGPATSVRRTVRWLYGDMTIDCTFTSGQLVLVRWWLTQGEAVTTTPDPHPIVPWLTPTRRGYLYRLASVALVAAAALGLLGVDDIPQILAVAAAVLGVPVAALHTPRRT